MTVKIVSYQIGGICGSNHVIKLDIQGAELIALKGAVETIRRCRPVIMVEEKATGEAAEEIDRIRVLLQGLGMVRKDRVGADRIYVFA